VEVAAGQEGVLVVGATNLQEVGREGGGEEEKAGQREGERRCLM